MSAKRLDTALMQRLLRAYVAISLLGVIIISLHNLYINQFDDYFGLKFVIKLSMGLSMVIVFQLISLYRLRRVRQYLRRRSAQDLERQPRVQADDRLPIWQDLATFPFMVFIMMIVLGTLYSPTYHLLMLRLDLIREAELPATVGMFLLENLLFDQALTGTLATLLYITLRRISREYLRVFEVYTLPAIRLGSIMMPLILIFVSLFVISMLTVSWFVMNAVYSGGTFPVAGMFLVIGASFAFSMVIFAFEAFNFRHSLRELIRSILTLTGKRREDLHGKMPIVSTDETGQLAAAFNSLQERTEQEYRILDQELQLAHAVQQQLLPTSSVTCGPFTAAGLCRPSRQIGGDLFECLVLDDGSLVIVIGDVSGHGVQAALIMSAVVVLLRTEIKHGGAPAEILGRLNRQLIDTLRYSTYVTLALARFHPDKQRLDYASAGHVSPFLLRDGEVREISVSSLPIGIDADAAYVTETLEFKSGDRYVFYTDGLVETFTGDRTMLGFDGLAERLLALQAGQHPEEQIRSLLDELPQATTEPYDDDKTLVMVRVGD